MIKPITLSEQILFSTVRIETEHGTGTAFFFDFIFEGQKRLPLLITNKHVVKDASKGIFHLHKALFKEGKNEPAGNFFTIELDAFESRWFFHPNDKIDLCAMPFQPLRSEAEKLKQSIYNIALDNNLILNDDALEELTAVEDILMVGYPIGLWDDSNNLPLIRRGITATHPAINFRGESIGIIDAACFPGSSGSPVLIVNENMYGTKKGAMIAEGRAILIGVLYAGPQMTAEGQIKIQDIPMRSQPISITPLMIHLGYIVKAKEILILGDFVVKSLRGKGAIL